MSLIQYDPSVKRMQWMLIVWLCLFITGSVKPLNIGTVMWEIRILHPVKWCSTRHCSQLTRFCRDVYYMCEVCVRLHPAVCLERVWVSKLLVFHRHRKAYSMWGSQSDLQSYLFYRDVLDQLSECDGLYQCHITMRHLATHKVEGF